MKHLLILLFVLCAGSVSAQDVIVKKDGSTIVCRVVQVTATEIAYKKWSDLNGSNYVMDKSLASGINYENGKKETFGETHSQYLPNNQNDGTQKYNDKALLGLDLAASNPYKKVRNLRTTGWVGGIVLAGLGTGFLFHAVTRSENGPIGMGCIFLGSSAIWTSSFLLIANHIQRKADSMINSSSFYQKEMPFSNGSSISIGADLLSNRNVGDNTLGLGLRYNF